MAPTQHFEYFRSEQELHHPQPKRTSFHVCQHTTNIQHASREDRSVGYKALHDPKVFNISPHANTSMQAVQAC